MACEWTARGTAVEESYGLADTDMAGQTHGRHDRCTCPKPPHQPGRKDVEGWGGLQSDRGTYHLAAYMDVRALTASPQRGMVEEWRSMTSNPWLGRIAVSWSLGSPWGA